MCQDSMNVEKQKLLEIVDELEETLQGEKLRMKVLPKQYRSDPRLLQSLMSMCSKKINGIEMHKERPYFARIDFQENNKKKQPFYIGKVGVIDLDGKILITDWRAPISSVYYDGNLGNVTYTAPGGTMEGVLSLKRQIIIENQEIVEVFDVDSVSDDEMLKPYLGANADNRLKNIVASIQKEQNNIIRQELYRNVIVQGVAGSGKTTVALHKIAYLMYNYAGKYRSDQFMVIGPNKFFINYISNVLPDLDASEVVQYTFEELALNFIGEKIAIHNSMLGLVSLINGQEDDTSLAYRLSMQYQKELEIFFEAYETDFFEEDGIVIHGFQIMTKEEVLAIFHSIQTIDMASKLSQSIKVIKNRIINQLDLSEKVKEHFRKLQSQTENECDKKKYFEWQWDTIDQINTGLDKYLKKVLQIKSVKVLSVYKIFISKYASYTVSKDPDVVKQIVKRLNSNIASKVWDFEDLPALMYLKLRLFGNHDWKEFAHVVVDEAQDFGTFHFYIMKNLMTKSTFSIFGDLTQGIYQYRSIQKWEEVKEIAFNEDCSILKLEKSYRTTIEIMNAANLVSRHLGLYQGKPVIRHGNPVRKIQVAESKKGEYILKRIKEYHKSGHQSIAIICKSPTESEKLYNILNQENNDISLMAEDNEVYLGGVCVVTSYLAKGLEFDAVIIHGIEESLYDSTNSLDMKLLYVAMTRALHHLELLYTSEPTKPLESLDNGSC